MKIKIIIIFLFAASLLATLGCADKKPRYKNNAFEFIISYPTGWEAKEKIGSAIVAFIKPRAELSDFFQETVAITVDDLTGPVTLSQYTEAAIEQIKAIGRSKDVALDILESSAVKIGGRPGHRLVYVLTQYGIPPELAQQEGMSSLQDPGTSVQMMLVWTIRDERAYLLTYVALKEKYNAGVKDVEEMIRSFKFI